MAGETPAKGPGVLVTVAPGRTVQADGKMFGPGAMIRLPRADVLRLRALGYLVDPKGEDGSVAESAASANA